MWTDVVKREEKLDISVHTWSNSILDPTEIRNPSETLLVKLGPMLKKLGRNPKV